jgi:hypothetical protein
MSLANGWHEFLTALRTFFIRLHGVGNVVWLCLFSTASVAVGSVFLALVPQGREIIQSVADADYPRSAVFLFYLSHASWALSAWYCARVILDQPFARTLQEEEDPNHESWMRLLRRWYPRILSIIAAACVPLTFLTLEGGTAPQATYSSLSGGLVLAFVMQRRWLFKRFFTTGAEGEPDTRPTNFAVAGSLAIAAILFLAFWSDRVTIPRLVGAPAIVVLAFTGWTVFGSFVLVLMPKRWNLPSLALLPIFFAGAASFHSDNHIVQSMPPPYSRIAYAEAMGGDSDGISPGVAAYFEKWVSDHGFRKDERIPVFIVTASGGGIRAAYWTGAVLAGLSDAIPGFDRHVFAISGVSGGSLGASAYVAALADADAGTLQRPFSGLISKVLDKDFLSPVLAYLLFPDLMQRFVPMPVKSWDRSLALEEGWQATWKQFAGSDRFSQPFHSLYIDGLSREGSRGDRALPLLYLNSTTVEDGRRIIASPLSVSPSEFTNARDFFDAELATWSVSLAQVTHNSARFTYVSPAGSILDREGRLWGRVVDGGYHENSGAQTGAELAGALRSAIAQLNEKGHRFELHAIVITNSPGEPRVCDQLPALRPRQFATEYMSPIDALLNTRDARGSLAKEQLAGSIEGVWSTDLCDCPGPDGRPSACHVSEFAIPRDNHSDPPLGWYLSPRTAKKIREALEQSDNAAAACKVRRYFGQVC